LSLALVTTTVRTSGCSKRMRLMRIVELDVHAQVVAVELELVAGTQAGVLVEVGQPAWPPGRRSCSFQWRYWRGFGLVVDAGGCVLIGSPGLVCTSVHGRLTR
jgi:hypothetical protein